nr:mucin-17 [Drosophila bipectinata]
MRQPRYKGAPRSKWHSLSKPIPAKPGPRANQTAATQPHKSSATPAPPRTPPRATTTPIVFAARTRTNPTPRRTENLRDIILTIREPARVEQQEQVEHRTLQSQDQTAGATNYWPNCCCSQRRTTLTAPTTDSHTSTTITTIPIVINSHPNPRILLIRVATSSNSNNRSNKSPSGTEHRAPRTRVIRIPFLPGSVPTRPPANQAPPSTSSLVNPIDSVTPTTISTYSMTGTATSQPVSRVAAGLPTTAMVNQTVPVSSAPPTQTLASMAGLQLAGADEPPSRQDLSGAMPSATVEEIDVPVFIDEYLQDIEATSSTCPSENGKEIFTETDILDFDINMFAGDQLELLEEKKMDPFNSAMDEMNNDNVYDDTQLMDDFQQLAGEEETLDMAEMCGVDFNHEELDLASFLTSSQDPMLGTCFSQSQPIASSSSFSQTKYITEEPLISEETSYASSHYGCSQESLGFGLEEDVKPSGSHAVACGDVAVAIPVHIPIGVKRSAPAVDSVAQKRSRLVLKISQESSHSAAINTPEIIEQVLNFDSLETATPSISTNSTFTTLTSTSISHENIIEDLRSAEEDTTTDFSAPNTPHSNYSASSSSVAPTCHSSFGGILTAPASPAFSVASTSQFSTSATGNSGKRKRGRPAKEHADGPDPELMSRMSSDELKAYQDRIKNNEASRISRRKTKKREEEEKQAEDELLAENQQLHEHHAQVMMAERKFKKYLMERQRKNSTYVKKEQH